MTQIIEERRDERTCAVIRAAVEPKALGRLTGLIVICVVCEICGVKGVRK
jgi:hypothetical protein